ncbi:MAG TPA: hypothetical protein PLS69_05580, partial [Terricaulis sp.]|nr:hypothetical protein [Terricaulis sp.]
MDTPDQAAGGGDWRMQLREMRTLGALRAEAPPREAAERLSDRALVAAAQNPDHSKAGRAAAADAARARNVSLTPWRLRVPGFIRPADLMDGEKLFFGWGRMLRKGAGLVAMLALLGVFIAAGISVPASEEAQAVAAARGLNAPRDIMWSDAASAPLREALAGEPAFERAYLAERVGLVLAGGFGAALLIWLLATWLRRKPARVLLLRKFNVRALAEPLSRMIGRELRPFGH